MSRTPKLVRAYLMAAAADAAQLHCIAAGGKRGMSSSMYGVNRWRGRGMLTSCGRSSKSKSFEEEEGQVGQLCGKVEDTF